ncbi:MAG: small-conductance mechanosensitive ion channel [Gemmatimonadaceae bacterium]
MTMLLQLTNQAPVQTVPVQTVPAGYHPSFTDTLMDSFRNAFTMILSAIPRILGFIVIVAIGWFVSSLLARAVTGLLRAIRFDELMQKSGLADFMNKMGTGIDSVEIVAGLVKWLVRIVVLLVAFDTLGLPAVSDVMRQFLLWLPNLIVALVVLFIGGIAARALGNVVRGATAEGGFRNPETLSNVARTAVWAFAIVVAVNQLGIASNLINTLFTGFVGALALAAGLAFGLGGRDLAQNTLDNWYDQAQNGKPRRRAKTAE